MIGKHFNRIFDNKVIYQTGEAKLLTYNSIANSNFIKNNYIGNNKR